MIETVGIRFKEGGKIYDFDPGELTLLPGEMVVVETARGIECGTVARANRTAAREEALSILQEVLDSAQASAEDKAQATQKATAIAENVLQESNIENLLLAKGFADSVVYIDGERCSVVVQSDDLQQQESLQILQIVVSQSEVAADQVQIMTATA